MACKSEVILTVLAFWPQVYLLLQALMLDENGALVELQLAREYPNCHGGTYLTAAISITNSIWTDLNLGHYNENSATNRFQILIVCLHATAKQKLVHKDNISQLQQKCSRAPWFSLFILHHCCKARLIHISIS